MLYDPKWEKKIETKADRLSLAGFIAWLEQQPPETEYCFSNPHRCVLAAYLGEFCSEEAQRAIVGPGLEPTIISEHPRTYGAALDRARAAAMPAGDCTP